MDGSRSAARWNECSASPTCAKSYHFISLYIILMLYYTTILYSNECSTSPTCAKSSQWGTSLTCAKKCCLILSVSCCIVLYWCECLTPPPPRRRGRRLCESKWSKVKMFKKSKWSKSQNGQKVEMVKSQNGQKVEKVKNTFFSSAVKTVPAPGPGGDGTPMGRRPAAGAGRAPFPRRERTTAYSPPRTHRR